LFTGCTSDKQATSLSLGTRDEQLSFELSCASRTAFALLKERIERKQPTFDSICLTPTLLFQKLFCIIIF
jgi:hypothetical protein